MTTLAPLVTTFFRNHLAVENGVSKHTIASYSDSFKFLCRYVSDRLGRSPSALALEDLDARMIRDYLTHRESDRRIVQTVDHRAGVLVEALAKACRGRHLLYPRASLK